MNPQETAKKQGKRKMPEGRRFQPGQSGNPNGRPKGISITKLMTQVLEEVDPKTKKQMALTAARAYVKQSLKNSAFANIVLDRTEGTVVQRVEIGELESLPQEMAEGRKRAIEAAKKAKEKSK